MIRRLTFSIIEGHRLSDKDIETLWQIRTSYLTLTKTAAEDLAYFRDFITIENGLVIPFRDTAGTIQGFFTSVALPMVFDGRRGLVMYTKYFYMHKAYRGHPKSMLAPWMLVLRAWRDYGLQALYFAGTAFPQSYVSIMRTAGNVRTLADEDISSWERAALLEFMHELYPVEWDEGQQVIRNQNVPDAKRTTRSTKSQALYERYEQINPTWREGHSIPMIFAINFGMMRYALWQTAKRLLGI